jgi:uncharacterized protein YdeI (YjbR/CyaY-like superfamily)
MATTNKRIDAYIASAQPFSKPVLVHLRKLIHQACPEVEETVKWGMPFFEYKGPLCSFAAFKQHAVFGFWKEKLIKDPKHYLQPRSADGGAAMGHLGKITSLKDLPPDKALLDFIKQAAKLNDEGVKLPSKAKPVIDKKDLVVPDYITKSVNKNKKAAAWWNEFSPGKQKEYIDWLEEAKTEETRDKRLKTAVEWIAEGKIRNWKYVR